MKIAINSDWGGFGVSKAVYDELNLEWDKYGYLDNETFSIESDNYNEYRAHPKLISAIEIVGIKNASGALSKIRIVDVPDDIKWEIDNYDGMETVHEEHRR